MPQPIEEAWRLMEPNWLSPREDRAGGPFKHAPHPLGVHLNRGLQEAGLSGADYEILAVLSGHDGDRMPAHALRNTYPYGTGPCGRRARPSSLLPVRAQFPGLHADYIRKVALQRDAGRQRAVKDAHLGDLAVRIEQDEEDPVDRGVSDLQPEVCGVVGLAAEDLHIGVVGRQDVEGLYSFHGDLAADDWLIAERAVQHHVRGEQTGEGVFVCAAVNAVDEGLQGGAVGGERGHGYSS